MLRSGVMVEGVHLVTEEGTTQGSPLSPLLSNVVLDELDKESERRGLEFCRFADDCNIFVGSEKAAVRVMGTVTRSLKVCEIPRDDDYRRSRSHIGTVDETGDDEGERIVGQQKKRRHLFKKLVKHGVARRQAAKTVFSNRGRWFLSHTRAVERAYSNHWFTKTLGQKLASTKNQPHWFDVRVWIKLT